MNMNLRNWMAGMGLAISLNSTSWAAVSGSYYQCLVSKLPNLISRPQVSELTMRSMDCFGPDQAHMAKGVAAAKTQNRELLCSSYNSLSQECKAFSQACSENRIDCKEALDIAFSCVPYVSTVDSILKAAGINSAENFTTAHSEFNTKAASCVNGAEYIEPDHHLFWERSCDDYREAPISFYELSEGYYDFSRYKDAAGTSVEAAYKAELLNRFALSSPSSERWQRVVASMIGLESMDSENPDEKAAAAKMLGQHGDFSAAVKFSLLLALNDGNPAVRAEAARSLRSQGDRKPLVVLGLISRLLDPNEKSQVRGQAAVALREQAQTFDCQTSREVPYEMDGSEDPNALQNGVPICYNIPTNLQKSSAPEDDYFYRMVNNSERCPDGEGGSHNVFDKYDTPEAIKDFSISANLCYHRLTMLPSKLARLTAEALLLAIGTERDPNAKSQMVAALRSLADDTTLPSRSTILLKLRSDYLRDRDFRIRRSAIFALARAARNESWLVDQVIPELISKDNSAEVRKTAIAAQSEIAPPSVPGSDNTFVSYNNGRDYYMTVAKDCVSASKANLVTFTFPSGVNREFFAAGFSTAKSLGIANLCDDPTQPRFVNSTPGIGDANVSTDTNTITLTFASEISQQQLEQGVQLVNRNASIPLTVASYKVLTDIGTKITEITFTIGSPLKVAELYQIKFKKGLRTTAANSNPEAGFTENVNVLFKTSSGRIGTKLMDLMENDPSSDVQFAAAESFLAKNEQVVIEYLVGRLRKEPARVMSRAAAFLSSEYVTYLDISRMTDEDKVRFLQGVIGFTKEYIDQNERLYKGEPPVKDYLAIPAMQDFYQLIGSLLRKYWVTPELRKQVIDNLDLDIWLFKKISGNQFSPLENLTYSYYDRLYYGPMRDQLKQIYEDTMLEKNKEIKNVDYLIYKDRLMKETE